MKRNRDIQFLFSEMWKTTVQKWVYDLAGINSLSSSTLANASSSNLTDLRLLSETSCLLLLHSNSILPTKHSSHRNSELSSTPKINHRIQYGSWQNNCVCSKPKQSRHSSTHSVKSACSECCYKRQITQSHNTNNKHNCLRCLGITSGSGHTAHPSVFRTFWSRVTL